jgi:2-polyprenyl-3-methyl-5-hydroxy-6-metoxy-1,4-benzoquinol methylase
MAHRMSQLPPTPPRTASYANVAGNHYDKYGTTNPIARWLMDGFLKSFDDLIEHSSADDIFEIGCGEGNLSIRMAQRGKRVRGIDLEESVIAQARDKALRANVSIPFSARDLFSLTEADAAELVVCCEVLEHVPDPDIALDILAGLARKWLLLSVPREPLWRAMNVARGKYMTELGNTPGHIQHWSSAGFANLVSRHVKIVEVRRPLPWTMLLCRVP